MPRSPSPDSSDKNKIRIEVRRHRTEDPGTTGSNPVLGIIFLYFFFVRDL